MLYPKANACRQVTDLCGIWQFKLDKKDEGVKKGWYNKMTGTVDIGVPGSWNDQLKNIPEARDYVGDAWYYLEFYCPAEWKDRLVSIWFGAVNYRATVWLNGKKLGHNEGGFLPFQYKINKTVKWGQENLLALKVNNILSTKTLPPLQPPLKKIVAKPLMMDLHPRTSYDFFPYAGIHRPVRLVAMAKTNLDDITVTTDIKGRSGIVSVDIGLNNKADLIGLVRVEGFGKKLEQMVKFKKGAGKARLTIPQCKFWSHKAPNLYDLTVSLMEKEGLEDEYTLNIGVRTVKIRGNQLLLNGKPVYLKGFGKHEDFHIIGKGVCYPLLVADFELLDWINANSFRTSHYPYSEEWYDMADRRGILIIDETSGVGISAHVPLKDTLKAHKKQMADLYHRDKNHPSVIMWSVANEAMTWDKKMVPYFRDIMNVIRKLEKTRPITGVVCSEPHSEKVAHMFDLFCVNRYYGQARWVGRLEMAEKAFSGNIEAFYKRFKKPVFLTEFGCECIPGFHANPPEIWSEEYQRDVIQMDIKVIRSKKYTIGEHIWNFAEFNTAQELIKTMYNRKGVFTRDRRPKLVAHWLKEFWGKAGKAPFKK